MVFLTLYVQDQAPVGINIVIQNLYSITDYAGSSWIRNNFPFDSKFFGRFLFIFGVVRIRNFFYWIHAALEINSRKFETFRGINRSHFHRFKEMN